MMTGFHEPDQFTHRRILLSLQGLDKSGKTFFSLTAPPPIAFFDSDRGLEGVVDSFRDKDIRIYDVPDAKEIAMSDDGPVSDAQGAWKETKNHIMQALKDKEIRTLVFDTATEIWELLRLAHFGKLLAVPPLAYTPVNMEYRNLVLAAKNRYQKTLILIHKVKDEYKDTIDAKGRPKSIKTGNYILSGFNQTGGLVDANIITSFDLSRHEDPAECFGLEVKNCRQNVQLTGMTFDGSEACNFPALATFMFPGSEMEEWI